MALRLRELTVGQRSKGRCERQDWVWLMWLQACKMTTDHDVHVLISSYFSPHEPRGTKGPNKYDGKYLRGTAKGGEFASSVRLMFECKSYHAPARLPRPAPFTGERMRGLCRRGDMKSGCLVGFGNNSVRVKHHGF